MTYVYIFIFNKEMTINILPEEVNVHNTQVNTKVDFKITKGLPDVSSNPTIYYFYY